MGGTIIMARNTREISVTVFGVTRLRNTANGNPRFKLHTDQGDYLIGSDAAVGYEVENYTNRIPSDGSGLPLVLTVTRAQRFIGMRDV
jgi:hypothetical protein